MHYNFKVMLVTAPSDLQLHCIAASGVSAIKFNSNQPLMNDLFTGSKNEFRVLF